MTPQRAARALARLLLIALAFPGTASATGETSIDFSERLDKQWDFNKPAESQTRFRAELAKHPAASREALEAATQLARTQSLQRQFTEADATLDSVAAKLDQVPARVRSWAGSLNPNIGWSYFDAGEPATALAYWQKALPIREAQRNVENIRPARWTIARGYRATGRLDEAEKIQLALVTETEKAGEPDGFVYEELAEIAVARGDKAAAAPWAAKAYALLKDDKDLKADKPARLTRLADLAKPAAPPQ